MNHVLVNKLLICKGSGATTIWSLLLPIGRLSRDEIDLETCYGRSRPDYENALRASEICEFTESLCSRSEINPEIVFVEDDLANTLRRVDSFWAEFLNTAGQTSTQTARPRCQPDFSSSKAVTEFAAWLEESADCFATNTFEWRRERILGQVSLCLKLVIYSPALYRTNGLVTAPLSQFLEQIEFRSWVEFASELAAYEKSASQLSFGDVLRAYMFTKKFSEKLEAAEAIIANSGLES